MRHIEGGVGGSAGVATLTADGGPLLGSDGVDARTSRWSGPTGVGAEMLKNGFCDVINCVELVSGNGCSPPTVLRRIYGCPSG